MSPGPAFFKLSGGGNDFIVLPALDGSLADFGAEQARRLCCRRLSLGADGLVVLRPSERATARFELYNRDADAGWRIDGIRTVQDNGDFEFREGTVIPAGGFLLVVALLSLVPAVVTLQPGRVVRALVERTWLGKPALPPDDPLDLVRPERNPS